MPLYTALAAGCIAIEADCFTPSYYRSSYLPSFFSSPPEAPENDLLVGHETRELQPDNTLSALYLNPLFEILTQQNRAAGNPAKKLGVWDKSPFLSLHLAIDYKTISSGHDGIPILYSLLAPFREAGFLTYYDTLAEKLIPGPLTIVGTGDADFELIRAYDHIEIFKDARFSTFSSSPEQDESNCTYVSASISTSKGRFSTSRGMSREQIRQIRKECKEARERGLIARYWGTPDSEERWRTLVESGVGMLCCDDLERGGRWLRGCIVDGVGVGAVWKEIVKEGEDGVDEGRGGCRVL